MKICRSLSAQANSKRVKPQQPSTYVVGLARDLDLLRGHLAQDSDGNSRCGLVSAGQRFDGGGVSYGRGKDAIERESAESGW